MTEPVPPPLPDDLLEYLDAAREPEPASPATKDRLFARLVPLMPPGGGGGGGGDGGGGGGGAPAGDGGVTATAAAASGALKGKLVVAAVSAMIGAAGGAGMHATFAPPKTVYVPATVSAPIAAAVVAPPVVSAVEVPSAEAPAPSVSVAIAPPSASIEPAGARKSTMRAERILLEAANAAIIRGDYGAALASLQQHKQTYPRGELAQERDILMAQANKLKASKEGSAPR